jgi:hypothetical protein
MAARGIGGRDLALGAGALWALWSGEPSRAWLYAGALSDAADAVAALAASRALPPARRLVLPICAAGAALAGADLARRSGRAGIPDAPATAPTRSDAAPR